MATIQKKIKLLRGLLSNEKAYTGPFYLMLDITRRCNLRCLGCRYHSPLLPIPSPGDSDILDISFDLVKKLCEELSTMGTDEIVLTGEGEPFLHPRLFDIISVIKTAGLRVTLVTNGTLLEESSIHSVLDSGLDVITVSLWASSPGDLEPNYPGTKSDHFRKVLEGLNLLSTFKAEQNRKLPSVVLHQPINRFNFKKIDKMVDLASSTRCNALSFSPFYTSRGKLAPYALSPVEFKSLYYSLIHVKKRLNSSPINHHIDEVLLRYRIGEAVWDQYPCYIGWFHSRIKVDGTVLPCSRCDLPLGHLKENSFQEIWNGLPYRNFRRRLITKSAVNSIHQDCDCGFCCFVGNNIRIHRKFKWVSPFLHPFKRYKRYTN
jgi:MoaA/NifB/PqqE/SkfB family radical SAM enzyme